MIMDGLSETVNDSARQLSEMPERTESTSSKPQLQQQ